jgi:hypothetical protein
MLHHSASRTRTIAGLSRFLISSFTSVPHYSRTIYLQAM